MIMLILDTIGLFTDVMKTVIVIHNKPNVHVLNDNNIS